MRSRAYWWLLLFVAMIGECHAALRILAETPLATASVGYDVGTKRYSTRVISMGIAIPADRPSAEVDAFAICANQAASAISTEVRTALGLAMDEQIANDSSKPLPLSTAIEAVARLSDAPTAEMYNREVNSRASTIGRVVTAPARLESLRERLRNGCGPNVEKVLPLVQMVFAVRACMASKDQGMCDEFVSVVPKKYELTAGFTPSQFDKLYAWLTLTQPRPLNTWFASVEGKPIEFAQVAAVTSATVQWNAMPEADVAIAQLESYVDRLRAGKDTARRTLTYLAPQIIGLSREDLAHVVDVVDHPFAASLLLESAKGTAFKRISDEIARSRIMDCARLRGSLIEEDDLAGQGKKTSLERVATCAGIDVQDDIILACLNGERCLPERTDAAVAALMSIQSALDMKGIAMATVAPRIGRSVATIEAYEDLARACARDKSNWDAMNCVLKASMSASDYELVGCVQTGKSVIANANKVMDCALPRIPGLTAGDRERFECFRRYRNTPSAAIGCTALADAPMELKTAFACVESINIADRDQIHTKCEELFGGKWVTMASCLASAGNNGRRLWCLAESSFPKEAQDVTSIVACTGGSDDWKKYAACAIQQKVKLKGPLGQALGCGLSSGGMNLNMAVCMTNLSGHLTQDQAIVLQCASSSPDLSTFAVCTGGQMTVKFLLECRGQHFGGDKCFGPNNEIRRALRAIGLEGIVKQKSPIARYMDFQVKYVWFQYAVAEKGLRELGNALKDVGHAAEHVGQAIGHGAEHLGQETRKVFRKWGIRF